MLLSYERPTHRHRSATVPIIRNVRVTPNAFSPRVLRRADFFQQSVSRQFVLKGSIRIVDCGFTFRMMGFRHDKKAELTPGKRATAVCV